MGCQSPACCRLGCAATCGRSGGACLGCPCRRRALSSPLWSPPHCCSVTHDRQTDLANAAALGNALLAFLVVPWTFTLTLYTGARAMHCALGSSGAACTGTQQRYLLCSHQPAAPLHRVRMSPLTLAGLHWTYPADLAAALQAERHSLRWVLHGPGAAGGRGASWAPLLAHAHAG